MGMFTSWSCKNGQRNVQKAWCTCKGVVLLIRPIIFLTFSLPSASLDLKVPNNKSIRMLIFNSYLFFALRKLSSSPCRRHLPCLCHSQQLNISQLLKKRVGLEDMSNAQEPVATNFFFLICELLVFESRFSAGTIYPISMIFDVVNKE